MNKEKLFAIHSKNVNSYDQLHNDVLGKSATEKWGMGTSPPLTLEPYDIELLGCKRGKMLDKLSKPGKNRFKYLFDSKNRMLNMVEYSTIMDDGTWLKNEDIFIYDKAGTFRFEFAGVTDKSNEARLQRVTYLSTDNAQIKTSYTFYSDFTYEEIDYFFVREKITSIRMRLWQESYFERFFEVSHERDEVSIFELTVGKIHMIYPKK